MIYYPKIYGTCAGANKAIETAYKLKKKTLIRIFIFIKKYYITLILLKN